MDEKNESMHPNDDDNPGIYDSKKIPLQGSRRRFREPVNNV